MKTRLTLAAILCVAFVVTAHGQNPAPSNPFSNAEFGSISELKGLYKFFVFTSDLSIRDAIVKELSSFDKLQSVARIEDADFILSFEGKYAARVFWHANLTGKDVPARAARLFVAEFKKMEEAQP